jgi:hypothetical protein
MSESSSNPWKAIVIGCGVVLLLACCCGGIGMATCASTMSGPYETAGRFGAALTQRNIEAAYAEMTPSFQASHPKAGFAAELAALPGVSTLSDLSMNSINTVNGTTTISGTLTTGAGPQPFSLEIVSAGESHKIQAITVGGQTLR